MDKISSMRVFAKVVELGSFSSAANDLRLSASVVTRHVAELERHLGTRLLNRSTRSLSLTERGQLYLERSLRILADIDETEALVAASDRTLAGTLKLAVTANFGLHVLPQLLTRFREKHPNILVDAILADQPIDLIARGRDLAVTYAGNVEPDMVARTLTPTRTILCASPEYLARAPALQSPSDLAHHDAIVLTDSHRLSYSWELSGADGKPQSIELKPSVFCNTAAFAHQCALAHLGISVFSSYIAQQDLQSGRLVRVLPEFELANRELMLVYPSRRFLTFKARAFMDFLIEQVRLPAADAGV